MAYEPKAPDGWKQSEEKRPVIDHRKVKFYAGIAVLTIGVNLLVYLLMTGMAYSDWREASPYSFLPMAHPWICLFIVALDMTAGASLFLIEHDWEK